MEILSLQKYLTLVVAYVHVNEIQKFYKSISLICICMEIVSFRKYLTIAVFVFAYVWYPGYRGEWGPATGQVVCNNNVIYHPLPRTRFCQSTNGKAHKVLTVRATWSTTTWNRSAHMDVCEWMYKAVYVHVRSYINT